MRRVSFPIQSGQDSKATGYGETLTFRFMNSGQCLDLADSLRTRTGGGLMVSARLQRQPRWRSTSLIRDTLMRSARLKGTSPGLA